MAKKAWEHQLSVNYVDYDGPIPKNLKIANSNDKRFDWNPVIIDAKQLSDLLKLGVLAHM